MARPLARTVPFEEYVETVWLPSKHIEATTLAAYRSYLDKHFFPLFGRRPMGKVLPSEVQRWVTTATENGLSPVFGPTSTTPCSPRSSNAHWSTGSSRSTPAP